MNLKTHLLKMLEEGPGEISLTRVVLLGAFLVCVALPIFAWAALSVAHHAAQEIPASVTQFCAAMFGAASTLKAVQKFAEKE